MRDYSFEIMNLENRQHIGFSTYAFRVIEEDMASFGFDKTRKNHSGFLNIIFSNYVHECSFSIQPWIQEHKQLVDELFMQHEFKTLPITSKKSLMLFFQDKKMQGLIEGIEKFPKDKYFKFKVNQENAEVIADLEEAKYFEGKGLSFYLKHLFEEYARLPYVRREGIFFKRSIQIIEEAILRKRKIKIQTIDNQVMTVIPYRLFIPHNQTHNLLIAIDEDHDNVSHSGDKIIRLPLFEINKIKIMMSKSGTITNSLKTILEESILQKSPQFISQNVLTFKIKFTPQGLKQYRNDGDKKPIGFIFDEMDLEKNIYTFISLESEIFYYFFKYGGLVEILEPQKTRQAFMKSYEFALKIYANPIKKPK